MMVQHVELAGGQRSPGLGGPDICAHQERPLGDVRLMAAGEIVQDHDLPAVAEIRLGDVRADKPSTAGHQNLAAHAIPAGIEPLSPVD